MKLKDLLLLSALFNIFFLSGSLVFAQPTAGLVGYFKFNGNLINTGSASMSATSSNTSYSTNSAGTPNSTLMFAGSTTSYASIVDNGNLDFTGDFSIAFGVYISTTALNQGLYDNCLNYGGCGIWFFASDNTLRFNFKNGSIGGPAALPANQWRAVCAVRSGSTIRLYSNGIQVATGTEGSTAISYPYAPVLGQMFYQGTGGNYNPVSNGSKIDELRFYNRALSAAEISILVGASLPLKLGDLTAVKRTSGIQLSWETITEENTAYFDIERSTNGTDFMAIGKINAKGNSTIKQYYTYMDDKPFKGINYYRLKLADMDNTYTYSRVIAVKNYDEAISLTLFPNPASSALQVQMPSKQKETASISITDASGKMVYSGTMQLTEGNNAASLPVLHLPNGVYYFTLETKEGKQTKAFIKQ